MLDTLILVAVLLISFILSSAIYINNPKSITNKAFVLAGVSIMIWSTIMYTSLQVVGYDLQLFIIRLSMAAGGVFAAAFLFLAIVFPHDELQLNKGYIAAGLVPTVVCAILALSPYMFTSLTIDGENITPQVGPGIISFLVAGVGYIILTIVVFLYKFLKSKGQTRNQLGFVLFGTLAMFFSALLANFIAVIIFETSSLIFLAPLFPLFFLGSIGYAILRHQLLDLRLLVARTVSYTLLLLFVASVYTMMLFGIIEFIPAGINTNVVSVVLAIVVGLTFNRLKNRIQTVTDKIFFKGSYDTEEVLSELTQIMASELNIEKLSSSLLTVLSTALRVRGAGFMLIDHNAVSEVIAVGDKSFRSKLKDNRIWSHFRSYSDDAVIAEDISSEERKDLFKDKNLLGLFKMKVKNKHIGFLAISEKKSGEILSNQDLELLQIFAPQAAIALQNAQSYQRIKRFSKELEKKVEERTEQLKKTQARALKKAKELLRLKDEFVFIATHDLGTPVTAVKGYSSLLQHSDEKFSEDTKENIEALVEASDRLDRLTNDLLQVARSDAGTIKIDPVEVDAVEQINNAVAQVKIRAKKRNITIDVDTPKSLTVMADEAKLAEVLENLMSNAVKYNKDKGSITVTARTKKNKAEFVVKDTGIGIPEQMQEQVFSKFFRAQVNGAESVPGTGLGLFVVKMLIDKMGGEISFQSEENKGTTFTFTLPLAKK